MSSAVLFLLLVVSATATVASGANPATVPSSTSPMIAPNGQVMAPGCVSFVQDGAKVFGNGTVVNLDGSRQVLGSTCHSQVRPLTLSGYVANGNDLLATGSNPIYTGYTYWTVPPNPSTCSSSSGQLLFFWNGLEPNGADSGGELLQPVLAHGYNGGGFGCYYYLQSWYLYGGGSIVSSELTVSVGDQIFGYMHYLGTNQGTCCWWYIQASDVTSGQTTYEQVQTSTYGGYNSMLWYFGGVLEAYSVSSCTELPNGSSGSTDFTSQTLTDSTGTSITPYWNTATTTSSPSCGYGVSTGMTYVDLSY